MGLFGGSLGVVEFHTEPREQGTDIPHIPTELRKHQFVDIMEEPTQECSVGWVQIDDKESVAFDYLPEILGFTLFSLRRDVRRIPGAVMRDELKKACDMWLKDHPGLHRVPKQVKADIRDAVKINLLSKTLPVPAVFDVAVNMVTGKVLFFSTSTAAIDLFETAFRRTFGNYSLRMIAPIERLVRAGVSEDAAAALNRATTSSVLDLIRENTWLGTGFARWLFCEVAQNGNLVVDDTTAVYPDRKMVLMGPAESGSQKVSITGSQERSAEIKTALLDGKAITDFGLAYVIGEDEGYMALDTETFMLKGLKMPPSRLESDESADPVAEKEAVFTCRLGSVLDTYSLLHKALGKYMADYHSKGAAALEDQIQDYLVSEQ